MKEKLIQLAKVTFFTGSVAVISLFSKRKYDLSSDHILNSENDPFLKHAEEQRIAGKQMFVPWITRDQQLIAFAKQCGLTLPNLGRLTAPYFPPVKIESLKDSQVRNKGSSKPMYVCVGGPPAAMVAIQRAINGEPVLYVNYTGNNKRAISDGSALHGEFDAATELPAFTAGKTAPRFFNQQLKYFLYPARYDSDVLNSKFPWLSLNISDWLTHPRQWIPGFRVAFGNYKRAVDYEKTIAQGKLPSVTKEMRERTYRCEQWLTALDEYIDGGVFLNKQFGSLITAPTEEDWQDLQKFKNDLLQEERQLVRLSESEMINKYGFVPRNAVGAMEKTHDRVFAPDFMKRIAQEIEKHGGEVRTNWELRKVLIDKTNEGGILEFVEKTQEGEIIHQQKFIQAHLSLGITDYDPSPADLASVTGVSVNALLYGVALRAPVVCGGSNHMVPMREPFIMKTKNEQGVSSDVPVTLVRLTAAAAVGPRFRDKNSYTFDGRHAIHLLHRVRETLPKNACLEILSVIGCNRMFIEDGMSVWKHPILTFDGQKREVLSVKIQLGAGGGGLTQCATEAYKIAKDPQHPFPSKQQEKTFSK